MSTRNYDLVVFGATSFVGQILVQRLFDLLGAGGSVRWALAGRSDSKLKSVRATLGAGAEALPLIVVDAQDAAGLTALCQQTRTVVTTVGPYALYGEPLVKACAEQGTHYCDLTGEVQWIPRMIRRYEATAKATGARLVHCCGFDSIPSDLGVWFLQQTAKAQYGAPCTQVSLRVKAAKGEFSGGTVASLINVTKEAIADPALRRQLGDPYALCPEGHGFRVRQDNLTGAAYDAEAGSWMAPFVMAGINTRVVHRSNALLNGAYGADFRYDETMLTGPGLKGRLMAYGVAGALGGFLAGVALPPTRYLLERFVVPKPGEGPSPQAQVSGFYDLRVRGRTPAGQSVQIQVKGDGDPGYGSTARLLAQAALCLTQDIPDSVPGGFWTPASLMGEPLLARLQAHAGLQFRVLSPA